MQHDNSFDDLRFTRFSNLDGSTEPAATGKRNGKPFMMIPPGGGQPPGGAPDSDDPPPFWDQERFFVNLNETERRTWEKILKGQPIKDIAREEGVSRQAIYARIVGNSKHQGGMIGKNFWVLMWWLARQNQNSQKDSL